jgi:hypothetical protein
LCSRRDLPLKTSAVPHPCQDQNPRFSVLIYSAVISIGSALLNLSAELSGAVKRARDGCNMQHGSPHVSNNTLSKFRQKNSPKWTPKQKQNKLLGLSSLEKLYRPTDRCLLAKLAPTFAERGHHVVRVMDPYGRILGFLYQSRYFFFQVAPQLYSRG